jgi:hypothetical protein
MAAMNAPTTKNAQKSTAPAIETAAEVSGLVTKKVVAHAATVSTRTVDNWQRNRLIPFVRLSARCVRFHLPSVLAALRKMEVKEATRQ